MFKLSSVLSFVLLASIAQAANPPAYQEEVKGHVVTVLRTFPLDLKKCEAA